ncbi:MAG: T9SS type A sorting domain-containing protein [Bacteroidota bacterium]|nr:MAG: T9SS type A sorting domain-containing protein [Bacteroidota bacterium]
MPDYGLGAKTCWPLSQSESEVRSVEWVVYPNPSSTVFIVQNKQGKKKDLYNVQGELLFTTNEDVIDVKPLARGMYYLQVEGQVKKVIIE